MQPMEWLLIIYKVPSEPASKRVTIWRDLKRTGAVYLQQCVCILPRITMVAEEVERIRSKIEDSGGEYMCLDIPKLRPEDEQRIINAFLDARNKEYQEIIEECETKFVKEIEFERFRQNYTFEETEEISQDLEKIRRWFARIVERDWFGADRKAATETWIETCQGLLDAFEQDVYERDNRTHARNEGGT
jgi:hypothetical protein